MSRALSESENGDEIGDFVVLRVLSRNVLGSTFLCQHAVTNTKVIIKTFPPEIVDETGFMPRYQLMCEQLVNFSHPNVLSTRKVDLFNDEPYAVLDYLPSVKGTIPLSLKDILNEQEVLSELQVYYLARQLTSVLAYAHASQGGMVHCNLKPSNILFSVDGQPKLAEFGLLNLIGQEYWKKILEHHADIKLRYEQHAQYLGKFHLGPEMTSQSDEKQRSLGALAETIAYMSPEQRAGERVTPQSNIYSLGLILYKTLTGRTFRVGGPPPSTFGVSQHWDHVIECATMLNPADRYPSANAMFDDITRSYKFAPWLLYVSIVAVVFLFLIFMGWALPHFIFNGEKDLFSFHLGKPSPEHVFAWADRMQCYNSNFKLPDPLPQVMTPFSAFHIPQTDINMVLLPSELKYFEKDTFHIIPSPKEIESSWISQTEITQKDFLRFMKSDPSFYREFNSQLTVHNLSFNQAKEFCEKLTYYARDSHIIPYDYYFTLPSNREWFTAYYANEPDENFEMMKRGCSAPRQFNPRPRFPARYSMNRIGVLDIYDNLSEFAYYINTTPPFSPDSPSFRPALMGGNYLKLDHLVSFVDSEVHEVQVGLRIVLKRINKEVP